MISLRQYCLRNRPIEKQLRKSLTGNHDKTETLKVKTIVLSCSHFSTIHETEQPPYFHGIGEHELCQDCQDSRVPFRRLHRVESVQNARKPLLLMLEIRYSRDPQTVVKKLIRILCTRTSCRKIITYVISVFFLFLAMPRFRKHMFRQLQKMENGKVKK